METIKFDIKTATSLHQSIGNNARNTQYYLKETQTMYQKTLPYLIGKCRQTYEEETIKCFDDCNQVILDMFELCQLIQDISKSYLNFDISHTR